MVFRQEFPCWSFHIIIDPVGIRHHLCADLCTYPSYLGIILKNIEQVVPSDFFHKEFYPVEENDRGLRPVIKIRQPYSTFIFLYILRYRCWLLILGCRCCLLSRTCQRLRRL